MSNVLVLSMLSMSNTAEDLITVFPQFATFVIHSLINLILCFDKGKDKEALFNVAYNETDNISSRAILLHNNIFNRYLPALLYLPSTDPFCASVSMGAASTIFYTFVMV